MMSDLQEPFATRPEETDPARQGGSLPEEAVGFSPPSPPRRRRPGFLLPLLLIGAGIVLLLWNLGYLPSLSWNILWKLWPILLIAIGIEVLIGRRTAGRALVSSILLLILVGIIVGAIFFTPNIPVLSNLAKSGAFETRHIDHPLGEIERATVDIHWSSEPGNLSALRDSANLIEGDIDYYGELIFQVETAGDWADVELDLQSSGWSLLDSGFDFSKKNWTIQLSPEVLLDLNLDVSSGSCDFDLSDLNIDELFIDGGPGSTDLILPAGQNYEVTIDGSSGSITIVLPESVGAHVELDAGSGSFLPDSRFELVEGERHSDSVWETDNYDQAEHTIRIHIEQGSGSVRIHD
jgi:hypothetical protein